MPKICNKESCSNPVFGGGFCTWHQRYRKDKKKPKKISPFSSKHLDELKTYRKLRDEYLKSHPICEVKDCSKRSNNLHHKAGRGKNLCNVKTFMACCETCHPKRIHENPKWARENGYLE